jgi:hypothetical protein
MPCPREQEQFTAEWDYIPQGQLPHNMNPPPRVAGKFDWKCNLFQMGLVSFPTTIVINTRR